jgi:imidazolonepropionase-like amidohydrolase
MFTYTGNKTRAVTKIFQKAGIKIAFTTKHTIGNILRQ